MNSAVALPPFRTEIPPGCARIIDSNGGGETFWDVQKPLSQAFIKENFPQAKSFTLRVASETIRSKHIARNGTLLSPGETYILSVRSPEKAQGANSVQETVEPSSTTTTTTSTTSGEPSHEELKCGICLETITEQGIMDACKHDFCFTCIFKWSKVTNTCPMCKAEFTTISRKEGNAATIAAASEESQTNTKRRSRRLKKQPPSVVNVQPKKQKYEYTRQELEQIAGIHDEEEDERPFHQHSTLPFFLPMNMGGIHQLLWQSAFPPGFLAHFGPPPVPVVHHPPPRHVVQQLEEDEDEAAWFEVSSEDDDDIVPFDEETEAPAPPRGSSSRSTVFTPTAAGGSRARLRQLMAMPPEERNAHRQNQLRFISTHQRIQPRAQPGFGNNLNTLKAMFMPTFDEELIATVLEQTGNGLDRAIEALLEMQPPGQTDVVPEVLTNEGDQPTANVNSTNVNSGSRGSAIVVDDDTDDVVALDMDMLSEPSAATTRHPKRKLENSSSQEEARRRGREELFMTKGAGSQEVGTEVDRLSKRRRLKLSFGEMWEGEKKEKEEKAEPKEVRDRMMRDSDRQEVKKEGSECDQDLVEMVWKDYAAFQEDQEKKDKIEGAKNPFIFNDDKDNIGGQGVRNSPPFRSAARAHSRRHFSPPLRMAQESAGEPMPMRETPCPDDGEEKSTTVSSNNTTSRYNSGESGRRKRRSSSENYGLPPHLRNSAGSLSRAK